MVGDDFGVATNPVQQSGVAVAQEGQAKGIDAGGDDASDVTQAGLAVEDRQVKPGMIRAVSRGPEDGSDQARGQRPVKRLCR